MKISADLFISIFTLIGKLLITDCKTIKKIILNSFFNLFKLITKQKTKNY